MSTELEQGTPEWLQARAGKITGSRVGAILGVSPFTTRRTVMREMASELRGDIVELKGPQLDWGNDNEDVAAKLYDFLFGGDKVVSKTGFWEKGLIGASPDRLVGDDGLLEIKCPYGIRDQIAPRFKSIKDPSMKHYYHQMQAQMYVTDRVWCDFFQWTPNGSELERVDRDMDWYRIYESEFKAFLEELEQVMKKTATGGAEERVALSARWSALSEQYHLAALEVNAVAKRMADAKQGLIDLMEASEIDHCEGAGIKVMKVARKGSVDYKAMAMDNLTEEVAMPLEEQYRRSGTSSWTIKEIDNE